MRSGAEIQSATAMLVQEKARLRQRLGTQCSSMDAVLGGGVRCGEVTEICTVVTTTHPRRTTQLLCEQGQDAFAHLCT